MLSKFEQYLSDMGFVAYVRQRVNDKWTDVPDPNPGFYSSTIAFRDAPYFLCKYWRKDGVEIIYGLNEYGHHPTLLHPRPRMPVRIEERADGTKVMYIENTDAKMSGILSANPPERVFAAMFDRSIILPCS